MARYPFSFVGEFRGVEPGGSFKNDDGEVVEFSEALKFEVELGDTDVDLHKIRLSKLDQVADVDLRKLKKGDRLEITGVISTGAYGASERYLTARKVVAASA